MYEWDKRYDSAALPGWGGVSEIGEVVALFDTVDTLDNDFCPEAPPLRRQGWSVPRSRFCSSDNAFRPFPISCVIQILQLASLREPLCANGRHSEQAPSALPKSHKSARAFKRVKTRLAFQRPEGKWAPTYSNFPNSPRLPWLIR